MKNLKPILSVFLSAVTVLSTAIISASALDSQKYDLNGDGKFDILDVTYLQISISGDNLLTDAQKKVADYNGDGKIDVQDVTAAQMLISGGDEPTNPTIQPTAAQPTTQPLSTTQPAETASYNREFADKAVELINAERAKEGLSALKKDASVTSLADIRAKETVSKFSHQRPDGSSWMTILTDNNVQFNAAAENIAEGNSTPEQVVKAWLDSPVNRASIMNGDYNKIGMSCYVDKNTQYVYYWNQIIVKS